MLKKIIPIIPIGLSIFVVMLVLSCALFVKPEPVVPVNPPVVNNDVSPTSPTPTPPIPVPLVVDDDLPDIDTSNWKVYTNKNYGFEIKHPQEFSSWEALYSPEKAEIINIGFRPEDMGGSVLMVKILDIPLQELPAYEHSVYGDITDEKIKIGNLTATKFSGQRIGIEKNKYTFFFSSHNIREEDEEIFYQMLSTFKFIESIVDTSNWKVYRNEKYRFELSFPSEWKDYKVDEKDNSIDFSLKRKNPLVFDDGHKEYYGSIFIIEIYSEKELQEIQSAEGPQPSYIIKNDNYVFAFWFCHDDIGFIGFPDYIPKEVYYGPIYSVKTKILPMFKFTDI